MHQRHAGAMSVALGSIALVALTAGQAGAATSYQWGTGGSGVCTQGTPPATSEWTAGNCVMALSGWVVKSPGAGTYQLVVSCEDTESGPYPTDNPDTNGAPANLGPGPFYGSVQYWSDDGYDAGFGWQSSTDLWNSNFVDNIPTQGSVSSSGAVSTWGTGTGAVYFPSIKDGKYQYAAGCLNDAGVSSYIGNTSNERLGARTGALAMGRSRVRPNRTPKGRVLVVPRRGGGYVVDRRVTLRPHATRTVRAACPAGTQARNATAYPEYATPDMKAPTAAGLRGTSVSDRVTHDSRRGSVTVTTGKLSYVTMHHLRVTCI